MRAEAVGVNDLRSALELLVGKPGQLLETDREVDPAGELAGVYRYVGAGGTVERPTRIGPAMLFNSVRGYPGARVLVGLMANRERLALLVGSTPRGLARRLADGYLAARAPVVVGAEEAVCQQVVHRAEDDGFDLRRLLPAPTNTDLDAGPYFCLGLVLGSDPELGTDVTIHRLCVQGRDELSIYFVPGRHLDTFRLRAVAAGRRFPVSINMGLDPAIYLGAVFEPPTTPLGYNELAIAGGMRGEPVRLVDCVSVDQRSIASAEVVIEGYIDSDRLVAEDQHTGTGHAMPEFPGYLGEAHPALPLIKVTAVTTRRDPILQTLVGPGEEHVNLAGVAMEASVLNALDAALPGLVREVYAHRAGGGKLLVILRCAKATERDDGRVRQAALVALGVYSELKNVILVDDDVDPFDSDDVLWAMTTRMQGDLDVVVVPGVSGHVLDPSQSPAYNPRLPARGTTAKTIYDATAPFRLRAAFERAHFRVVDPRPFAPGLDLGEPQDVGAR
jgi:gallate decarboxylase subunit C